MAAIPVVVAFTLSAATAVPASAAGNRAMCGKVLTTSTKLATDVGPCTGDGLIIGADGITLDLNGYRVIGKLSPSPGTPTNTVNARGVTFRHTRGSTVMNGEITRFAVGVAIEGGSANRATTLNVHDNIGTDDGDGVAVYGSNSNQITRNRVVHNGQWSGISLLNLGNAGSTRNVIVDNIIRDNNIPMFDMAGAAIDKRDIGIAVEGPGATYNQVLRNTVTGSGTVGIQVFPACSGGYDISGGCPATVPNDYNRIAGNTVNHNGFGA
ncbi:MAG: right-handed parallel beta-helix repeat-containing protein, partial [Actinobacteria bacterium]|nr:right-handed parallel beta-helix repeat-containing protein [Actinomycetota bacterium]